MLTYVINTSENKTFESDELFKLVGYNKICWLNCRIDEVKKFAKEIAEKQNVIDADRFRVAVIVDFYGYKKVRLPYGYSEEGYSKETGVDLSIYFPFIEMYLKDHLFDYLVKKEVRPYNCEIFYIQDEKYEKYDFLENRITQTSQVLTPLDKNGNCVNLYDDFQNVKKSLCDVNIDEDDDENRITNESIDEIIRRNYSKSDNNLVDSKNDSLEVTNENKTPEYRKLAKECIDLYCENKYSVFRLYCSESVSLDFSLKDYPYGDFTEMSFEGFLRAFMRRTGANNHITIHRYYTTYSDNPAKAAFDTFSLSLHLIRAYEREADIESDKDFYKKEIDVGALKDRLVKCWNKIVCARKAAQDNESMYYSLEPFEKNNFVYNEISVESCYKEIESSSRFVTYSAKEESKIREKYSSKKSGENLFLIPEEVDKQVEKVHQFYDHDKNSLTEEQVKDIENAMTEYFKKLNDSRYLDDLAEECKAEYAFSGEKVKQCPSKQEYDKVLKDKQNQISEYFDHVLNAQYLQVDYEKEKKQADTLYENYDKNVKLAEKKLFADIILGILAMVIMVVPYILLRNFSSMFSVENAVLYLNCILIFGGLFALMIFIYNVFLWKKILKQRRGIKKAVMSCFIKSKCATKALECRFTVDGGKGASDLEKMAKARFEIRQLTKTYEENLLINERIKGHRELLESVEDKLSSILNNLGVQPVLDVNEKIEAGDFNISKPYLSSENRVYKIFSIESIESMFKKGDEKKWLT